MTDYFAFLRRRLALVFLVLALLPVAAARAAEGLTASKTDVAAGEELVLDATISRTFLDGSRIPLMIDGKVAETKWALARKKPEHVQFPIKIEQPGEHRIAVGEKSVVVRVSGNK